MRLLLQARSNPLAWWWGLLTLTGSANIAFWFLLYRQFHDRPPGPLGSASSVQPMLLLCAAYVLAAHSGRFSRARMFSESACSTPGYRAFSLAGPWRPWRRSASSRSGRSS